MNKHESGDFNEIPAIENLDAHKLKQEFDELAERFEDSDNKEVTLEKLRELANSIREDYPDALEEVKKLEENFEVEE